MLAPPGGRLFSEINGIFFPAANFSFSALVKFRNDSFGLSRQASVLHAFRTTDVGYGVGSFSFLRRPYGGGTSLRSALKLLAGRRRTSARRCADDAAPPRRCRTASGLEGDRHADGYGAHGSTRSSRTHSTAKRTEVATRQYGGSFGAVQFVGFARCGKTGTQEKTGFSPPPRGAPSLRDGKPATLTRLARRARRTQFAVPQVRVSEVRQRRDVIDRQAGSFPTQVTRKVALLEPCPYRSIGGAATTNRSHVWTTVVRSRKHRHSERRRPRPVSDTEAEVVGRRTYTYCWD